MLLTLTSHRKQSVHAVHEELQQGLHNALGKELCIPTAVLCLHEVGLAVPIPLVAHTVLHKHLQMFGVGQRVIALIE